jgi:hypothetical protein
VRADAEEEIWLGRDNLIEWAVLKDDVYVSDLSAVTQAVVCFPQLSVSVDSDQWGSSVLWWTDSVTGKILPDGTSVTGDVVRAKLGNVSGLVQGEYEDVRLILFDPANPNGVVVSDNILVNIHAECFDADA